MNTPSSAPTLPNAAPATTVTLDFELSEISATVHDEIVALLPELAGKVIVDGTHVEVTCNSEGQATRAQNDLDHHVCDGGIVLHLVLRQ